MTDGIRPAPCRRLAAVLTLLLLGAGGGLAQEVPPDAVLREFLPVGDHLLEVGGSDVPEAEILFSETARAYLVVSPELGRPILLWPGTRKVEAVPPGKLLRTDDGGAAVAADAELAPLGSFEVVGDEVAFSVSGRPARLKPKPPLLGPQELEDLARGHPEYERLAAAYDPSSPILRRLRAQGDPIKVEVYFGSWCPFCKQMVPRIMRVARELQGSRIEVEFYGLPQPISDDPVAQRKGIRGVPTGVIYAAGREVGRITGNQWKIPELALQNALLSAPTGP